MRWRICLASGEPFAIAGLWREWNEPEGLAYSFTMLTLNADAHPLLNRFHAPGKEKRGVVVLPKGSHGEWLACRSTDEVRSFLKLLPATKMHAHACPAPQRATKARPVNSAQHRRVPGCVN